MAVVDLASYARGAIDDGAVYGLSTITAEAYGSGTITDAAYAVGALDDSVVYGLSTVTDAAYGLGAIT